MIINEHYLKQYSILPENFDVRELLPFVDVTEALWLRPILGTTFYEELEHQVADNDLSDENGTLLAKAVYPYLANAVVYEALPWVAIHPSEVGITVGKSDNSDSASLDQLTYLQSQLRKQVEALKEFLVKYLLEHHTSFPLWEYEPTSCGCREYAIQCGCCQKPELLPPNPLKFIYTTRRIETDLR